MTAAELLAVREPHRLFRGSVAEHQALYRKLCADWHPDRHAGAREAQQVFQHVADLYRQAHEAQQNGTWQGRGTANLELRSGSQLVVRYPHRLSE